jgi:hypothetical protein
LVTKNGSAISAPDPKEKRLGEQLGLRPKKTAYFSKGGISPFILITLVLAHAEWTPEIARKIAKTLVQKS